jgi:hypothetical protein
MISKLRGIRFFLNKQAPAQVGFLVAGTQKGGTTALDAHLRTHPEICMSVEKEVHFFDRDEHFMAGTPDYARYHRAFDPRPEHRLLGEATPFYMYCHEASRRIWEYNRAMKLIVLLRNPIERAFSHWNMERDRGADSLSFGEAIRQETSRCREALPRQHRVYSYVDRGFYSEQLRRLWRFFPREQTLIARSEDLQTSPKATLDAICDFLDVAPLPDVEAKTVHQRPYAAPMQPEDRSYLQEVYRWEIPALEQLLGWDCAHWRTE